ncbi:MAG: phytanoyl-CoA dioxygenase family protein [Rhodospirillales bacterium]
MTDVATSALTRAERERFETEGYLFLPGLLTPAETARMIAAVDAIQAAPEAPGKYMKYYEDSLLQPGRRVLNRVENFVPYYADLADIVNGEAVLGRLSALFGERAVLFKDKINFKLPGGGAFEPHQDVQAGWDSYAQFYINISITVDETSVENGCLEIAKWRHRREMIGKMWEPLTEADLAGIRFEPVPTRPGDCIIFDSYIPHQSAPNLTDTPRRVIYATYNGISEGDHREQYYADKRKSFPPDCEREPGREYKYRV